MIKSLESKPILFTAVLAFILLMCTIAFSCAPAKRLERKKEAAVNTVLGDVNLINRVGEKFRELEPCIPSQPVTTKRDTTTITNTVTKILLGKVDTLLNTRTDTLVIEHVKTVTIRDTVKVKDLERENRLIDSLNAYKIRLANSEGQIFKITEIATEYKKRGNKWFAWCMGILGLIAVGGIVWAYFKFVKNPVISLIK